MVRNALLASSFSTPGVQAVGCKRRLQVGAADAKWGKIDWGGCCVAEYVNTEHCVRVRAPCFLVVETKLKASEKPVTALFLALAFVYDDDDPSVIVALGYYGLTAAWLRQYYGKLLKPHALRWAEKYVERSTIGTILSPWGDALSFKFVQPTALVERWGAQPASGRVANDVDVYHLFSVLVKGGRYLKLRELEHPSWDMDTLLGMLPAAATLVQSCCGRASTSTRCPASCQLVGGHFVRHSQCGRPWGA